MSSLQQPIPPNSTLATTASSNQSGSNDFVKKLFLMLQEDSYKEVVRWTAKGDSFVVLNTNEFTKDILPKHFKHSNFASFVRQLNKYDFHKVKISNEAKATYPYGEDAWEFKHPEFRINDADALENIKRKGPTSKKAASSNVTIKTEANNNGTQPTCNHNYSQLVSTTNHLKEQVESLKKDKHSLYQEISVLERKYKTVVENIVAINTFNERYYSSMNVLMNSLVQNGMKLPPLDFPPPVQLGPDSGIGSNLGPLSSDTSLPSISHHLQSPLSHHQQLLNRTIRPISNPIDGIPLGKPQVQQQQSPLGQNLPAPIATPSAVPFSEGSSSSIQAPTPGQLPHPVAQPPPPPPAPLPQQQPLAPAPPPTATAASTSQIPTAPAPPTQQQVGTSSSSIPTISPKSQGIVVSNSASPNASSQINTISVPNPKFHVLLVEDDNVCIQLCRKFLVKYGCSVTVVTDGLNAISTVEHTKYDLVLMDIVMPNLDGATATSVIRSFDTKTPIIAMTGNIEDNDLVTYLQNGMSDILAKPFTKDDLYAMLSKHLLDPKENKQDNEPTVKKQKLN
ncbi:nuclear response regulator and transcription factor, putative [Candida dubliniensis CD36]|uniref:Transcription factor n=1 Tax=Candida dubliniensis (strain CD36 / ATCC MYA-646 / CBS 7987 / NCPF 3949 / NRRL Y-17841) TaxID=573826 RepID=B9WGX0_CANDC|nr:nuclear response regulator and transcription factor, putative [Candida dubliniensis CD36]CAX41408.1 nuclear response regulator and transcription factor, putative [Candida dubliniensis CD36]